MHFCYKIIIFLSLPWVLVPLAPAGSESEARVAGEAARGMHVQRVRSINLLDMQADACTSWDPMQHNASGCAES